MSWTELIAEARAGAALRHSPAHGERHWRAVAAVGLRIAGLDARVAPDVCLAFAILHDCRRVSEHRDPQHGPRAADVARGSAVLAGLLGPQRAELVAAACHDHNGGAPRQDEPRIGACFDADRFTLGRVGIEPHPRHFSVIRHDPEFELTVRFAEAVSDDPPDWGDLVASLGSA